MGIPSIAIHAGGGGRPPRAPRDQIDNDVSRNPEWTDNFCSTHPRCIRRSFPNQESARYPTTRPQTRLEGIQHAHSNRHAPCRDNGAVRRRTSGDAERHGGIERRNLSSQDGQVVPRQVREEQQAQGVGDRSGDHRRKRKPQDLRLRRMREPPRECAKGLSSFGRRLAASEDPVRESDGRTPCRTRYPSWNFPGTAPRRTIHQCRQDPGLGVRSPAPAEPIPAKAMNLPKGGSSPRRVPDLRFSEDRRDRFHADGYRRARARFRRCR